MANPTNERVFRESDGALRMYVRDEVRPRGGPGRLFVGVEDRVVITRFVPDTEEVVGELVNDTAGRAEAGAWEVKHDTARRERDAMALAMRQACEWLSPTQGADLKALYLKLMKS